jgi:hypothetical protein
MENVSNISSKEELLKLREEGKISEQEYKELFGTIRRPPGHNSNVEPPAEPQFQAFQKRILVGGFIICILGVILGLILDLPFVWGLGLLGIIVVPIKSHLINKRQQSKRDS